MQYYTRCSLILITPAHEFVRNLILEKLVWTSLFSHSYTYNRRYKRRVQH